MHACRNLALVAGLSAAIAARAQSFANGNFETGTLSGWTVADTPNGLGAPGSVVSYDIDATGPLETSLAAAFVVGNAVIMPNHQAGVELTQSLVLTAGTPYTFNFNWAAQRTTTANNGEGGVFSLIVGGDAVATASAGPIGGTNPNPIVGHLTAHYTPTDTGPVDVGVRITRPYTVQADLTDYVDNITITAGPAACYPNCDGSTTPPILNVLDFTCFLNRFAAGDTYANCDASTMPPVLNVLDFTCFLNRFAAGCS